MRLILDNIEKEAHTDEKLYFYTVRNDNTSYVYAKTFVNSYERAEEYQSRYIEAKEHYPSYCDVLLEKSTTFACGTIRILLKKKKRDSVEYRKMKSFLKANRNEIRCLKGLPLKYKIFAMVMR